MQPAGLPAPPGSAARHARPLVHRTLQIRALRTELKSRVRLMDLVRRDWLPARRRAEVCVTHTHRGPTPAEQSAGSYEIQHRLFSTEDHRAWGRNASLSDAGSPATPHRTPDRLALGEPQPDAPGRQSDVTKDSLASHNAGVISSIVISQLMDGTKPKENGAPLLAPCAHARPPACPGKQPLASRGGVAVHRALACFPGALGAQTPPSEELGPETRPPPHGEPPGGAPQRGFASITVTARRVGPPVGTLGWGAAGGLLCTKCRGAAPRDPPAPAGGAGARRPLGPSPGTELPSSSSGVGLQGLGPRTRPCEGHAFWITSVEDSEVGFSPDAPREGRSPLLFSSCVQLRVSQQCPSPACYLDRPPSGPGPQPHAASPKTHRSVLSLSLNCSSHRLTAEGAGGPASAQPTRSAPRREAWGPPWSPGLPEAPSNESPSLGHLCLGPGTCPWSASPLLDHTEARDAERRPVALRTRTGPRAPRCCGGAAEQLCIHIPGCGYRAVETKVTSGSNEKQPGGARVAPSAPAAARKPAPDLLADGRGTPSSSRQRSPRPEPRECQQPPARAPGPLCPAADSGAASQEASASAAQVAREGPRGHHTCCGLVVKIKECRGSGGPMAPEPEPAPPEPAPPEPAPPEPAPPEPAPPEPAATPDPLEDCSEGRETLARPLTLQEALEARRPQFIFRSQERLKKLEHKVHQRKAQRKENLGQTQSLLPARASKKQFTVPHPLSDNLFKPKERCISEKEMQMRSKRIYNNLPEVKKKKEEQKKRVALQSNRLRAEVFKKQLLDQLLQRKAV